MNITRENVERMIDASLGSTPAPTIADVTAFVKKTLNYNFAATLTEPFYIPYAAPMLHDAGKKLVTVIAYPLGGMTHEGKFEQVKQALADGADELDISMDVSLFLSGKRQAVIDDLRPIVDYVGDKALKKMIYFASLLNEEQQLDAAEIAIELGFQFVKTNTGFGFVTTPEQISLIKRKYGNKIKVMCSGGVRTSDDAIKMINAGADRIATSASFQIVEGLK